MPTLKETAKRIKTTKNIAQITKAMEMISAVKLKKTQNRIHSSKDYLNHLTTLKEELSDASNLTLNQINDITSNFLSEKLKNPISHILIIVIGANRGLAGAFDTNLVNFISKQIKDFEANNLEVQIISFGDKLARSLRKIDAKLLANFTNNDKNINIEDSLQVLEVVDEFITAHPNTKVLIGFTNFVSTINQQPSITTLLEPLKLKAHSDSVEAEVKDLLAVQVDGRIKFLLEKIAKREFNFKLFNYFLNANVSEQAARMMAMSGAHKNAQELKDELELYYAQARQAAITTEILDIIGAKLAMD